MVPKMGMPHCTAASTVELPLKPASQAHTRGLGGHQEIAVRREFAYKELKHRRVGHALVKVGLQHGELVEVGKQ
jgi:hypothetical protein